MSRQGVLRVASVPRGHVYVRHLDAPGAGPSVVRLADPAQPGSQGPSPWWPPAMLSSDWVRANPDFDVMHVHFGFDDRTPEQLTDLAETLTEHGKPLVYTVHDLRNPHQRDRAEHDARLDVLVPAADALLTLTPGAAEEIHRRWGRRADVVPHPHVVDLDRLRRPVPRRKGGEFRVGLHVKSLRACMDPLAILPTLADAVAEVPGGVLQVDGHTDVIDPMGARHDAELLACLESLGPIVDLRVHDYFSDAALVDYLASLDASVLPYRFGTHSGWLEACRDVGTHVLAPTCGYYDEQGPVHSFVLDEERFEPASLRRAVLDAAAGPAEAVSADQRVEERHGLGRDHARLYRGLAA